VLLKGRIFAIKSGGFTASLKGFRKQRIFPKWKKEENGPLKNDWVSNPKKDKKK
jgi:hypothetical protein